MFGKTSASPRMRGTRAASFFRSEHRAEAARIELAQAWKQRLMSKSGGAAAAPAAGAAVAVADGDFQYEDE